MHYAGWPPGPGSPGRAGNLGFPYEVLDVTNTIDLRLNY
jgi:hypothetical protein